MNTFYEPDPGKEVILLNQKESHHCIKVLRMQTGDRVRVIDGKGNLYFATIADTGGKVCRLEVNSIEEEFEPLGYELHVGIAPTKNQDRFEWFIEKAVEIGVTSITPLLCEHSERTRIRQDRVERVILSAMKQSVKAHKPVFREMVGLEDWLIEGESNETRLIAHCRQKPGADIWEVPPAASFRLAIGPEGDFSDQEIESAMEKGFKDVSLGKYRLRTETAGVVACAAVYFNQQKKPLH